MKRFTSTLLVALLMVGMAKTVHAEDSNVTTYTKNSVTTVETCTGNVTLSTAVDYVITGTSNALTGSINITNQKAVVLFQNIKPATVIGSYLSKIKINGTTAQNGTNCRVAIYRHGAIVLPYSNNTQPLTVYDALNLSGASKSDFNVHTAYRALGTWDNAIYSFTLKRGYMVTMANHIDGTGYSHCFIANDADITVNLPATMRGSVSFLRIFPWQWPSKKGYAGKDDTPMNLMNVTWFYQWNAENYNYSNYDYVPQRHHETGSTYSGTATWAWPSWGTIDALNNCTHVLGQNEPDNTSGNETYMTVDQMIELHKYFLYSGLRIGTFATTNPNATWVKNYVDACKARNMRVDFVATHYYKGGQSPSSFISDLKALYTATGLPVWVTEWNNGANWTSESGFTLSDGWYTWGSGDDYAKNGQWLVECLEKADENEWIERLAIYNDVEQKRYVHWITDSHWTTTAGGKYGAYQSKLAYDPSNEVFMSWVYSSPTGVSGGLTYDSKVRLSWQNPNTDCTKTVKVQRKNGNRWTDVATDGVSDSESRSITFTDASYSGATYRICNVDADGTSRYSEEYAFPSNAIPGMTQLTTLPSDVENYYFRFNSAESSTDLCWGLADGTKQGGYKAVQYATPTVDGSDTGMAQTWQMVPNGSGYALANLSYETQVMHSPNAWNFRTNGNVSVTDSKAAYLPAYNSSGYWTVQNLGHSNVYCGLWDNNKNFVVGAELAGNRTLAETDHLYLYSMLRQDVHQMRIDAKGTPTDLTYAISNHAFTWGTYNAGAMGSGANNAPNGWTFNKTFDGWNDSFVNSATINGQTTNFFNTWAGVFTYAELSQTVTSLPNGIYRISADFATDANDGLTTLTAVYGAPTNGEYVGRSENVTGAGADSYNTYQVYVQVDDNQLTIGARSDGTWFKVANFKLEYMGKTTEVSQSILDEVEAGRVRQQLFLISSRLRTARNNAVTAATKPMYKETLANMNYWLDVVNTDYANSDVESLNTHLASFENAVAMANQSAAVYATLKAELDASQTKKTTYSRTAGLSAYNTAYNTVNSNYLAGEYLDESIPVQINKVKEFTNLYLMSDVVADSSVSPSNPADITAFILDKLPLTDNANAWMAEGTTATASNANGVEFYNKNFTMLQNIYGLPTGFYKLTTQAFYRYGNQGTHYSNYTAGTLVPNAQLYINSADGNHEATGPIAYISDSPSSDTSTGGWTSDYSSTYGGSVPNDMTSAGYAFATLNLYQPTETSNNVVGFQHFTEGEPMALGAKKETLVGADWTIFYTFKLYYLGNTVTLSDVANTAPAAYSDVNVRLERTLKTGEWNTLCLPFNMTEEQVDETFGSTAVIKQLSSAVDGAGGNTTLGFTEVQAITANVPYIMQIDANHASDVYLINGVTISAVEQPWQSVGNVVFRGNYVYPTVLSNTNGADYYIIKNSETGKSELRHSPGGTKLKGFRAYFHVPSTAAGVKSLSFQPDEGTPTGLHTLSIDDALQQNKPIYDLTGRRVQSLSPGLFIMEGRKVLIR